MHTLHPFVFWVGFHDNSDAIPVNNAYHTYQCLMLAPIQEDALAWGQHLAQALVLRGEAVAIERTWIEAVIDGLLTDNGLQPLPWATIEPSKDLYQGTAECIANPDACLDLNVCIRANTREQAHKLWQQYLQIHYPNYHLTTCSSWFVPIT